MESIPIDYDQDGQPIPTIVHFSQDAQIYWDRLFGQIQSKIYYYKKRDPSLASYLGKFPAFYVRLAGLLSIAWEATYYVSDNPFVPGAIPLHVAKRAWLYLQYCLACFIRIQKVSDKDQGSRAILMTDIWETCAHEGSINTREICRRFNRMIDGKRMNAVDALEILRDLEKAEFGKLDGKTLNYSTPPTSIDVSLFAPIADPVFEIGDEVTIADPDLEHHGEQGMVTKLLEQDGLKYAEVTILAGVVPVWIHDLVLN